jgi:predicted nuclease of predicted toxin-antitoxin system
MSAPKIYLNENLSWKIAKALREYGYDAVSSQHEAGMNAEEDDVQFDFAVSEKRAVLTNSFGDFVRLCDEYASSGKEHYGVIFTTKCTTGTIIKRMRGFLKSVTAEQIKNQIRWLNEFG